MKIKIKANSIYKRLQIWNGIFNLTKKELEVISAFIKVNIDSKDDNLCSKNNKNKVAKILNFEDPNTLNNYVKRLKDKKALSFKNNNFFVNKLFNQNVKQITIEIA